jgi:hypothetical protein
MSDVPVDTWRNLSSNALTRRALHFIKRAVPVQPRCSTCWAIQNLAKCSSDDCPNLICSVHANRYGGRCTDCWDTACIILPPRPLGHAHTEPEPMLKKRAVLRSET